MNPVRILVFLLCVSVLSDVSGQLRLSEFMPRNTTIKDADGVAHAWVEVENAGESSVDLGNFSLANDTASVGLFKLPSLELSPGAIAVIWLSGLDKPYHADFVLSDFQNNPLLLADGNVIIDHIRAEQYDQNEAIFRNPDVTGEWVFTSEASLISPGITNRSPGPWRKVKNHAAFTIGDAGTFGCLVHDGKMWILDYETVIPTQPSGWYWENLVQVWSSEDGTNWNLVNPTPPYSHLASVVSFKGYMWAFDGKAYRSKDGIEWELVSNTSPKDGRITVFKDELWAVAGGWLYKSSDGITWTEVRMVPWLLRPKPALLEHKGMLYAFGGGINYGTMKYELYFQDVWKSADGVNWELATYQAPWEGGIWFTYASYDDKIWMICGYNEHRIAQDFGNTSATWYSEDGRTWKPVQLGNLYSARHAQFTWVFKDHLWLAAGYGGGGPPRMYNDIWKFSKVKGTLNARVDGEPSTNVITTYGHDPFNVSVDAGFGALSYEVEDSEVISVENDQVHLLNAGTSTLEVRLADNTLYDPRAVIGFKVAKKDLIVSATDDTRPFLQPNPDPVITFDGFVNGDDATVIDEPPSAAIKANQTSPVGEYPIEITGGSDNNYNVIAKEGTLTITGLNSSKKMWAYPNPGRGMIHIAFEDEHTIRSVSITDSRGQSRELEATEQLNFFTVDFTGVSEGLYVVTIVTDKKTYRERVIIGDADPN